MFRAILCATGRFLLIEILEATPKISHYLDKSNSKIKYYDLKLDLSQIFERLKSFENGFRDSLMEFCRSESDNQDLNMHSYNSVMDLYKELIAELQPLVTVNPAAFGHEKVELWETRRWFFNDCYFFRINTFYILQFKF